MELVGVGNMLEEVAEEQDNNFVEGIVVGVEVVFAD